MYYKTNNILEQGLKNMLRVEEVEEFIHIVKSSDAFFPVARPIIHFRIPRCYITNCSRDTLSEGDAEEY